MKAYVIERMYAGSYINKKLGGEAINLLHDDHNNNYIFISPYGFIDKKYDNKVKGVILTRLVKAGIFEVLGIAKIAKDGQVSFQKGNTLDERYKNAKINLDKFVDDNDISYGQVSFRDIHNGLLTGADITFKSEELFLPKETFYIIDKDNCGYNQEGIIIFNFSDKRFPKQSLHSYITDLDNPQSFKIIEELIENKNLWEPKRLNKVYENKIIDKHFNFLEIIKKDYDELVYSNFFAYIFKNYSQIFIEFMDEVLNLKITKPYLIEREKENIDLWIEDKDNIVIIENKIKSGINGLSPRHDFSENSLVQSQLLKYYKYGKISKGNKKDSYFIFIPDYNKIDLKKYSGSKNYQVIRYSAIFNFFKKKQLDDIYFSEFVNSLYKHTKNREVDYAEDMAIRFLNQIKRKKQ